MPLFGNMSAAEASLLLVVILLATAALSVAAGWCAHGMQAADPRRSNTDDVANHRAGD
jgi:F0F1-type ATP synthase membrane subunit a